MNIERTIKTQKAMDYIIYMIVSSYFSKATCVSHNMENKLFLYYKETSINTQLKFEEKCIKYVEGVLTKELPNIWNSNVEVKLVPDEYGIRTAIFIKGKGWLLRLTCNCFDEKGVKIKHKYIENNISYSEQNPNLTTL